MTDYISQSEREERRRRQEQVRRDNQKRKAERQRQRKIDQGKRQGWVNPNLYTGRERQDRYLESQGLLNYQTRGQSQAEIAARYGNAGIRIDANSNWWKENYKDRPVTGGYDANGLPFGGVAGKNKENTLAVKVYATEDQVRNGEANWTDMSTAERQRILSNPDFYKSGQITNYSAGIQQQILADRNFNWDNLPDWQQTYYSASSNPAVMGAAQGLVMSAGNPGGVLVGGVLGWMAGASKYDPTKEFWQQGDDNNKLDLPDSIRGAFGLLNWGAEQVEKGVGVIVQAGAILTGNDPDFDPTKRNLDIRFNEDFNLIPGENFNPNLLAGASWDAGSITFEVLAPALYEMGLIDNIFEGRVPTLKEVVDLMPIVAIWNVATKPEEYKGSESYLGVVDPVELKQTYYERIQEAEARLKNGEDYRTVMMEMQTGILAQVGDMAGQGFADPLNIVGRTSADTGQVIARISGDKIATEAFKGAGGLYDARTKLRNIINNPGEALKIDPNYKVNELGWMTRAMSGLTTDNKVRAGWSKKVGLLDYSKPKKNLLGFIDSLATLDPASRARTGQDLLLRNLGGIMSSYFNGVDVDGFANWWSAFSNGDMTQAADLSNLMAQSPEFYTVLPAAKGFDIDGQVQLWKAGESARADITRIADALGENPMSLIEAINKEGGLNAVQERLRLKNTPEALSILGDLQAGRLDVGVLTEAIAGFADGSVPYHPGQWFAETLGAIKDHYDQWAINNFKLDEQSRKTLFRTAHVLKSMQGILLLGANPGYMISNVLPTMVTRAATGVFGYMTPKSIDTFMSRMGYDLKEGFAPNRIDEGVGPSGMADQARSKGDAIREATQGKGWLTNVENVLGRIGSAMPFNKLSRVLEGYEGRQAYAIGMKQFIGRSWRRGSGFREIPQGLVAELTKVAGPRAKEILYSAIESGLTKTEIANIVSTGKRQVFSRSLVNQAAQDLNIPASRAAAMLEQVGILDALDSELKNAKTEAGIRAGFERAKRNSQEAIDRQAMLDATARIEHVANRMNIEGMKAITDIVLDTELRGIENWMKHYERMGEVADAMDSIPDASARNRLWAIKYSESNAEYRRYNAQRGSTYLGILKAVGLESGESGRGFLATLADTDKAIDNAYRVMRDLRNEHFKKWNNDFENPRRSVERGQIESQIDAAWKQATKTELENLAKLGEYMGKQYESLHGIEAGEAARQAWESITAFRREMTTRRDAFRASLEGMPKAQRDIESRKFWGETYNYMIIEMGRIKTEAIEKLDRIARGGGKPDGDASPSPAPTDPTQPTSPAPARTDEMQALHDQAEQRKRAEQERLESIWEVTEPFGFTARDKYKFISSLNKYGDFEVTSYDDTRLTPEYVTDVLTRRQVEKERIRIQQEEVAVGNALNRAQQEFISKPRSELPEILSNALLNEATRITDVVLGGKPGRKIFADGEFVGATASTYPKWYNDLQQTANGRTSLLRALDKIVKDAGVDKGAVVGRVKEFLLMTLKYGDEDTNNPPNLNVMKALGADDVTLQNAADVFNGMMRTDFTVEQLTREAGDLLPDFDGSLDSVTAFDAPRWEADMMNAFEGVDFARMAQLVDELPAYMMSETYNAAGDTYADYISRTWDDMTARLEDDANRLTIAEKMAQSEDAISRQTESGERSMNRQRYYESLTDVFKLSDEEANAVMEITDAADRWYANATGLDEGAFYRDYIESVERTGDVDLAQRETQQGLFGAGEDTPLFSGVPQKANVEEFNPTADPRQEAMFDTVPQFGTGEITYAPNVKGGVRFQENGKAIIRAWEKADVSTIVHENAHIFRRMMEDVSGKTDNAQVKFDYDVLKQWAGVKDNNWTRAAEEKFARGFERYLADGSAPTPQLKRVFDQFKAWMQDIYNSITGSAIDVELTPQVKEAFDRLLTGDVRTRQVDMRDMLLQMGYDSKAYFIDIDGSVRRRPEFNIRVDSEAIARQSDTLVNGLQEKVKQLRSRPQPAETTVNTKVPAPDDDIPAWSLTYEQYTARLLQDQRQYAERRIQSLGNSDELSSTRDFATEVRRMERLLKRDTLSWERYGDVRESYRQKIEQALINEEAVPENIKQAYYEMGKSGELSVSEFSNLQQAGRIETLFQDADPRMPLGGYEETAGWLPHSDVMNEGWSEHVNPLLDAMQETAIRNLNEPQMDGVYAGLSDTGKQQLNNYLKGVGNDLASTKMSALRYGAEKRDFAMLNYNRRYGIDAWLDIAFPYQFFYTRSMMTWAMRGLDSPAWISNYARLRTQQDRYENNLPERLRGKIGIDAPWMPDWMGDKLYIDPLSVLFTPHNFMRPMEQMMRDQNMQTIEAERILQEWAGEGTYSNEQIVDAVKTRSGEIWDKAFAEAQMRREAEISNPLDFVSTMFGPAWYLTTPMKLLGLGNDGAETLTELPITRTARALDTVTNDTWAEPIGNLLGLFAKPEEMFREAAGLPEFGEYGDYYVDRQLANMVAEGLISSEDAQIAMIEREGEYFEQALERVEMELAMRIPLMGAVYAGTHGENLLDGMFQAAKALPASLFGAGLLPEGELHYRGLKDEWNEAWKLSDAGDEEAINRFFDEHPEYEAYLAKGKEPEERLKSFLIGQIWDGYMSLGDTDRRLATAEMGDLFEQSFLDKETRSYDTLDVEQLTRWAQMLNQRVPKTEQTMPAIENPNAPIDFYDPEISKVTDTFFEQRRSLHPDYYELEQGYYAKPKSERAAYLLTHPELRAYWDWKDTWYDRYPELQPVFKGQVFKRVDFENWSPMLVQYVETYAYAGDELPTGAYKALEQMWINEGRPYGSVQDWLDRDVAPAIMYGNGE